MQRGDSISTSRYSSAFKFTIKCSILKCKNVKKKKIDKWERALTNQTIKDKTASEISLGDQIKPCVRNGGRETVANYGDDRN